MKYLNDYLLTLAYLMGERTIQSSTTASRTEFVQDTLNEIYRAYKWPFATSRSTLSMAGGVASLPTTFDYQQGLDVYFYQGSTQTQLEAISELDAPAWQQGDYKVWVTANADGTYNVNTKDTTISSIVATFQTRAPVVGASTNPSAFDDTMTVALGARRYIKLSQDPNADISQDEELFQRRLQENIAATQVSGRRKRARFLNDANGHRIGSI